MRGIMRTFLILFFVLILASPSFALFMTVPPKQDETKESPEPAETKPADVKPVNTKPAEEKTKPVKRIDTMLAVFDLEISDKVDKAIVRPLSESIRREIVMSGRYEVIDRGNMNKILGEQKFQLSGCASGECIVEAGQLLGVGKIVTGSIGLVGKTYYLALSVINVETGKIENSSEDKCKCEIDDLIDSSKRLVKRLLGEQVATPQTTAETPKPAETKQSQQPPSTPFSKGGYTDSSGIEMVYVKGGCYQMGESYNAHEVCLDDFYIGKYEVTQGQWKAIMGNNPSYFKDCGDNCPVEQVSWSDAQDFIRKFNNKSGKNYRLPTEAEWEYSARSGGKNEKYSGTSNESELADYAWYYKNSGNKTHPVGQKKPNGLGLYDMSGNVWEWVNDWYDSDYFKNSPKNNPTGPSSGKDRVLRGGSWFGDTGYLVATYRFRYDPAERGIGDSFFFDYFLGFRLVSPAR
ncbi:MAG: SUMF1/EgtB/PvdO family nonheme iron enzyme [Nitrospirae bacterium]|nr:SUMF1/EgtB/PvdO family nonheme iron enzyme [Nitrospirota bacterium]